jgi:hypothetical protein
VLAAVAGIVSSFYKSLRMSLLGSALVAVGILVFMVLRRRR